MRSGFRYLVPLVLVGAVVSWWLHRKGAYPLYESIMGGVFVGVLVCVLLARRDSWLEAWRDLRGK